ncbi:efflux RND transporter permease subunit [Paraliomyxa miuraensis]|uniref:efflux RND transporter permease subunit n=1 Tax=Paraliomyxa miuraensis TaxID=376150 RepID=UPI00224C94DC|nr:efflux RND transporter permease subunit [Paraliomyxa miuraensis]MCX4240091.1 efflux RND transporter permease subunit [Paraliomyxa miuraensis]
MRSRLHFTTTRPVAVLMVFLAVMVFGGFSIRLLPINLMPDISYPKLTVRTEFAGAAPGEVENNVSRPLEEMLGVVTGLTRIESVSRAGYSDVILEFAWGTDMDEAGQDVLEKLDAVRPNLPDGVDQPLILRYDPTLDPVLTLSLGGEGSRFEGVAGLKLLRRIAERDVRRLVEPVEGVAAVKIKGGLEEEVHVELDEGKLRRTGVGIDTIIRRLEAENINLAGGTMRDGRTRYLVRTVNEFRDLDDIGEIVVVRRDGRDVRLRDVARVEPGYEDREVITRVDGREAVEIEVYKEADANIVEMAHAVRSKLKTKVEPRLQDQYGAVIEVASDRSRFIESSIAEVRNTAVVGGLLAVLVLFFFLRDLRSTLIVAASIPVSVLVTFAPLSIAGVSLNIMSLGGLAMGVGMLVDNSIVVLESIHRCRQEGDELVSATLRGTSEVGSAVVASTLTTIAVFFPMVFVEGVAGQMFGDLGLAVVFSLLASLAVALFLIPMLASRTGLAAGEGAAAVGVVRGLGRTWARWSSVAELVEHFRGVRRRPWRVIGLPYALLRFGLHVVFELLGKVIVTGAVAFGVVVLGTVLVLGKLVGLLVRPLLWVFSRIIDALEAIYPPIIRWCLRNRIVVYLGFVASFGVVVQGAPRLDTELIPELHQGELNVDLRLPVGTPLPETDAVVAPVEAGLLEDVPHLESLTVAIGSERDEGDSSDRGEHTARLRLTLERQGQGDASRSEAGASGSRLRLPTGTSRAQAQEREEEALVAVRKALQGLPDVSVTVSRPVLFSFKTPVEVEVRGNDLDELAEATTAVAERLRRVPGLRDVEASIRPGSPEIHIVYDRDAIARLGLDVRTVAERIRDEVQGTEATRLSRGDRKVPIRVRLSGAAEATVEELRELVVNPGLGKPVPLHAVADITVSRGPNEIRRIGQQRVGVVTANVEGAALGAVAGRIAETLRELSLPESVTTAVTGQSQEWETSSRSLYLALGLSIFLVYVIMASQFESLIYPLLILFTIPLALVGVIGALLWLEIPLSVVVFLGAIMLAGIVVNNAIVLVDYAGQLKARGMPTAAALEMAGRVRLRPILMTTLTTMLGLLPMALGMGDGAEIRAPLAVTVIAGLGLSTVLTLVVIPTLYAGVDRVTGSADTGRKMAERLDQELAAVRPEQLTPEHEDESESEPEPESEPGGEAR